MAVPQCGSLAPERIGLEPAWRLCAAACTWLSDLDIATAVLTVSKMLLPRPMQCMSMYLRCLSREKVTSGFPVSVCLRRLSHV